MPIDYSQAADPRDFSELIPHGTVATVQIRVRPGGVGEDGMLKRTAKGDAEMLDCEFVVVDGPYAKKKFWDNFMVVGSTDGQKQMVETSNGRLKKILESARGIVAGDTSEQMLARYKAGYKDFDNMIFIARIGVRKGESKDKNDPNGEKWPDKNYLAAALGPESKDWHPVEQPLPFNGGGAGATAAAPASASAPASAQSAPITPPKWAQQ